MTSEKSKPFVTVSCSTELIDLRAKGLLQHLFTRCFSSAAAESRCYSPYYLCVDLLHLYTYAC